MPHLTKSWGLLSGANSGLEICLEINPTKYYRLENDNIISENGMIPLVSNASY